MGRSKALLHWGAVSLVEHAFSILRAAGVAHVLVAVREEDRLALEREQVIAESIKQGNLSFVVPRPVGGMSASLRTLVDACGGGALALLQVDRPFVTAEQVSQMIDVFRKVELPVVARCSDLYMPPVILPMTLRPVLQTLAGDMGLSPLFRAGAIKHASVPFDDPDGLFGLDVDTPSDWEHALMLSRNKMNSVGCR